MRDSESLCANVRLLLQPKAALSKRRRWAACSAFEVVYLGKAVVEHKALPHFEGLLFVSC